jgi:hypothetical protein
MSRCLFRREKNGTLRVRQPCYWRRRDGADVVELLRVVANPDHIRKYVETRAPQLVAKFDDLAAEAQEQ